MNQTEWKKQREQCEAAIRAVKDILREPHQPRKFDSAICWNEENGQKKGILHRWPEAQVALIQLKQEATRLYMLRAHYRRHLHQKGYTLEEQAEELRIHGLLPKEVKPETPAYTPA